MKKQAEKHSDRCWPTDILADAIDEVEDQDKLFTRIEQNKVTIIKNTKLYMLFIVITALLTMTAMYYSNPYTKSLNIEKYLGEKMN